MTDEELSPRQLRRLAEKVTTGTAPPDMGQDPGQYIANLALYRLAWALRRLADEDERRDQESDGTAHQDQQRPNGHPGDGA